MTTKYTRDDIIEKAREIATMIANTEEVDFFKRAEAQINENQSVREKIASLKSLQKQAVNFQHLGKEKAQTVAISLPGSPQAPNVLWRSLRLCANLTYVWC